jgi:hypothetical protein
LHGKAERPLGRLGFHRHGLQMLEQRRPFIPGGFGRPLRDIVTIARRDRDRCQRLESEIAGKGQIVGHDGIEDRPVMADEVDLVDGEHDVADAQ